jgi:hypothetical protein
MPEVTIYFFSSSFKFIKSSARINQIPWYKFIVSLKNMGRMSLWAVTSQQTPISRPCPVIFRTPVSVILAVYIHIYYKCLIKEKYKFCIKKNDLDTNSWTYMLLAAQSKGKSCERLYSYTGCPSGNVPDVGRMFLKLKYTDITQNTYIQSWTVTEIMAREKCGLLAVPRTLPHSARERVLKRIFP